jgi:hypothetical protein
MLRPRSAHCAGEGRRDRTLHYGRSSSAEQSSAVHCNLLKALLNAMSNGMHDIVSSSSQPRQYFQATSCRGCRMHDYKHYKQCILHVDCNHENAPLSTLAAIATIVRREAMPSS